MVKKYKYNWKYHFNEIFNRLLCQEQNKPSSNEIETIKMKCAWDYSRQNIYNNTTYNQRKHLNYIWITLNGLEPPYMTKEINHMKEVIKLHMSQFFKLYKRNNIEYRLIMDIICKHYGYEELSNSLFYKRNKVIEELVETMLFSPVSNKYI